MATELYNFKSLGTLAGATGATVVVTNALKTMFGISPKWLSWVVAELICIGVLTAAGAKDPSEWGLAFLNGFLVYTSAIGTNAMGNAAAGGAAGSTQQLPSASSSRGAPIRPRFWSSWF